MLLLIVYGLNIESPDRLNRLIPYIFEQKRLIVKVFDSKDQEELGDLKQQDLHWLLILMY